MIKIVMIKNIIKDYKNVLIYGLIAIAIGLVVGAVDALFGRVLLLITDFRDSNAIKLIPFLPLAGIFIATIYKKIGKDSIKGMSLIFDASLDEKQIIPKRLIPLAIVSTWITHLFGGSAGREGVAVQIGGTVSHAIAKKLNMNKSSKIFLVAGMAAGFAGLFQTPFAAIFFAMEVLVVGSLEIGALFPSIIAAFVASYTSHALGLEKFGVKLDVSYELSITFLLKLMLIGVIFGVVGGLFAYLLNYCKTYFASIFENPIKKILILGVILSIALLILHQGRYAGLGTNIIQQCFTTGEINYYDWLLKFILTILTISAGFQGGEVTPLFTIGASLGAVVAGIMGIPIEFAAALGYAALFGSATNTILAPIFIGVEVFGYENLPYFFVVCAIAYVFNGNKSIYTAQR